MGQASTQGHSDSFEDVVVFGRRLVPCLGHYPSSLSIWPAAWLDRVGQCHLAVLVWLSCVSVPCSRPQLTAWLPPVLQISCAARSVLAISSCISPVSAPWLAWAAAVPACWVSPGLLGEPWPRCPLQEPAVQGCSPPAPPMLIACL